VVIGLLDGVPIRQGNTAYPSNGDLKHKYVTRSIVVDVTKPPRAVFFRGDKREVESSDGGGEPLVCLRFGSGGSTPSRGVWCFSGITTRGPACR
jgi:hypothetical protein